MKLTKFAVENYYFTLVVTFILLVFGATTYRNMSKAEDPPVIAPGTGIVVTYPGADPQDMEELIVAPIEDVLNKLDDVDNISSSSTNGVSNINIEFLFGVDPDEKFSDVTEQLNTVVNDLPEGVVVHTHKFELANVAIMQFALVSGTAEYSEMQDEFEELKNALELINGIQEVEISAYPEQEVRISLDMERLAKMNIPLNNILGAIQSTNYNLPGGSINLSTRKFNIKTSGSFESIEDIKNTTIPVGQGQYLYLKDIAAVDISYEDLDYFARFNGERAIFLTANRKSGTNIFDISKEAKNKVSQFKSRLPDSMALYTVFDQSKSVNKSINNFFSNLILAIIVVGIIVLIGIALRLSIIVMFTIPLSIIIALGLVGLSGFGVQEMTITGLIVSLGLLVDNAIVVSENISRHMKKGKSPWEASISGTGQITSAIVMGTITTCLAFMPILLMRDIAGEYIYSMPLTVIYTLSVSLILALTYVPMLSSKILKGKTAVKENYFQKKLNNFIQGPYKKMLAWSLNHPVRIIGIALIALFFSVSLFRYIDVSMFGLADKSQFFININTPAGTNLHTTDETARYVETILADMDEVELYATNVGRGNPRIFNNIIPEAEKADHAQIVVDIKEEYLDTFRSIVGNLRKRFADYPGARIEVKEIQKGGVNEAPIAIKIIGKKIDVLQSLSLDAEQIFNNIEGIINVDNPLNYRNTDIQIKINREKAAVLGISLYDIDRIVRTGITGITVSSYRDPDGEEFDIVARLPMGDKISIEDLDRIYVPTSAGNHVQLKQVAEIEFKSSSLRVDHFNLERAVTITADGAEGYNVNNLTTAIINELHKFPLPEGYRYHVSGEMETTGESFGGLGQTFLIAIIAIFGVLVFQFKSITQPLIIFSAIPLAVIGSILALFLTKTQFSFSALIGLTSLAGIVINNSIILVDYANQLRSGGMNVVNAVKKAGEVRFVPIIFTVCTTIGGLLPLIFRGGSDLWTPMALTIIGGLLTSTMLTLIIVPVLYKLFTKEEESDHQPTR